MSSAQDSQRLSLSSNDFELFNLPVTFKLDRQLLDERWKNLQRLIHPDKFSMHDVTSQRVAMQYAVRVNEAYQRLKSPIKRATYICELNGSPIQAETNTQMPAEFLLQQMQWREELEEATSFDDISKIEAQVRAAKQESFLKCETYLDVDTNWAKASAEVRSLMFMERFEADIERQRELLLNA